MSDLRNDVVIEIYGSIKTAVMLKDLAETAMFEGAVDEWNRRPSSDPKWLIPHIVECAEENEPVLLYLPNTQAGLDDLPACCERNGLPYRILFRGCYSGRVERVIAWSAESGRFDNDEVDAEGNAVVPSALLMEGLAYITQLAGASDHEDLKEAVYELRNRTLPYLRSDLPDVDRWADIDEAVVAALREDVVAPSL